MFISQPLKSRLHYYEHDPPETLSNGTQDLVDTHFYYDLARFYAEVVDELFDEVNLSFPQCGKFVSEPQLAQRKNFDLYGTLANRFLYGLFGQFMFNFNTKLNYQELSMRINRVLFKNQTRKLISKVAEWEFEGQLGRLYFTSPQEQNDKYQIPHYIVVTKIVSGQWCL